MTLRSFWRTEAPSHPKISFPLSFPLRGGGVGGAAKNGKEISGVRPPERSGGGAEASDSNAYASRSHHHARGAWQINRFAIGNKFERS